MSVFRSARTSCTTSDGSRPVPQEKSGSLIYRHICLMNHVKTHQTNPMAPWHPLDALLTPWDPLGPPGNPPIDPLRPINRSLGLILRLPQLPHKSHSPSSLSPLSPPTPRHLETLRHWDLETMRPWDLETLRPWHIETSRPWDLETLRLWDLETLRPWEIPESDNSLRIPLSPAPLHSSPQRPMPFSPAHLQLGDTKVLHILPCSALSPSIKLDVKVSALRNSHHPSFLSSPQQASLIYLVQRTFMSILVKREINTKS